MDAGASFLNLPAGSSSTPNADAMNVDPGLEALASYIVTAEAARTAHDWGTVNTALNTFWNQSHYADPGYLQQTSLVTGNPNQGDLLSLDAYSHRILGFEYLYQVTQADKSQMQAINAQAAAQFQASVAEFTQAGLNVQAHDDQNILNQCGGWAAQSQAAWIDDSFTTSLKDTVNKDLDAAGNLLDAAGSALSFLSNPAVLIGGLVGLVALYFWSKK